MMKAIDTKITQMGVDRQAAATLTIAQSDCNSQPVVSRCNCKRKSRIESATNL